MDLLGAGLLGIRWTRLGGGQNRTNPNIGRCYVGKKSSKYLKYYQSIFKFNPTHLQFNLRMLEKNQILLILKIYILMDLTLQIN